MARSLSVAAKRSIFSQTTSVVWLTLLEFTNPGLSAPIRVVNNTIGITHDSKFYQPFPFQIDLPEESEDRPPVVRLTISNVDRSIIAAIRSLSTAPEVTLTVVTDANLDTVEIGPMTFTFNQIDYDAEVVSGELTFEPILKEPYPAKTFTPANFPGLF